MKRFNFTISLVFVIAICSAQEFSITKVEFKNQKVLLHYSILDSVVTRTYTVSLFSSKDNFTVPLQKVSGDIGLEVSPGGNKVIVWDVPLEFPGFAGKVGLEVRGRMYIPFVRVENFKKEKVTIKRGKPYQITWTGGTAQNILNFELLRGEERVFVFPNIANVGHHTFTLPTSIKPSGEYRFKVTDSKNKDEVVFTKPFRVKRKIPLLLKLAPLAIAGATVPFIFATDAIDEGIPDAFVPTD